MTLENEVFCPQCRMSSCRIEEEMEQNQLSTNRTRKQLTYRTLSPKKSSNSSPFCKLPNFYTTILLIIFGLLYMTSGAYCQNEFDGEIGLEEDIEQLAKPHNNTLGSLGLPSPAAVSSHERGKRKHVKCPKDLRHTFCMNNGRCHWIEDLKKPSCRCKKNWEGARCEDPRIELSSDEKAAKKQANVIIIATVISFVVLVAVVMVSCICWRRMKTIHKEIELQELEKEESLIQETESHRSTSIVLNE